MLAAAAGCCTARLLGSRIQPNASGAGSAASVVLLLLELLVLVLLLLLLTVLPVAPAGLCKCRPVCRVVASACCSCRRSVSAGGCRLEIDANTILQPLKQVGCAWRLAGAMAP